jgi:transcriptional regulatory protein GAL4
VNLDEALTATTPGHERQESVQPTSSPPYIASAASEAISHQPRQPGQEPAIPEAVPNEPDGFDWQEDVNDLADGMAALSVEPKGTGYLGMSRDPRPRDKSPTPISVRTV